MYRQNLRYCPNCGSDGFQFDDIKEYRCRACGFNYFFNPAAAVSAVVIHDDELLVTVRGCEPGIGMLDFPGGFVDPGESITEALDREIVEELSVSIISREYFFSAPNIYRFADVEYTICDVYFRCELERYENLIAGDDVADFRWIPISQLDVSQFESKSARATVNAIQECCQ